MLTAFILLFGCAAIFFAWFLTNTQKFPTNLPPGPGRFSFIVEKVKATWQNIPAYQMYIQMAQKYGPIIKLEFGALRAVVVCDHALIKEASTAWADRIDHPLVQERSFGKPLGAFMISGDVETWKEMRRFTIRTLRELGFGKQASMEVNLQEEVQHLVASITNCVQSGNGVIGIHKFFSIPVINILWSMFAETRFSHDDQKLKKLVYLVDRSLKTCKVGGGDFEEILMAFPFLEKVPFLFAEQRKEKKDFNAELQQFFRDHLEERRALGDYKHEQRDFVDIFLQKIDAARENSELNSRYTDEQLIVVSMDFFIAGQDTTNSTTEFTLLYLILYPNVQAKVQAEIDTVIGRSRLPSLEDMSKMPYTIAMMMEVSRLANVIPLMLRSPAQDMSLRSYSIPKGTIGILNYYAVHMDESIFENPKTFNPNRFLDSQNNVINSDKILPFGIGLRRCSGEILAKASVFIFITTLLQKFTFEQSPNHERPSQEPEIGFTQSPKAYHALIKERLI